MRTFLYEVFGPDNSCPVITVQKTYGHEATFLPEVSDFLLWYARDKSQAQTKYRQLFERRDEMGGAYRHVELPDGTRPMTAAGRGDPSTARFAREPAALLRPLQSRLALNRQPGQSRLLPQPGGFVIVHAC